MNGRPPALLLVCALGVERIALSGGDLRAAAAAVGVVRTGMGPVAAARVATRCLRDETDSTRAAVLATGFCAGLGPGTRPGDVIVATRVCGTGGVATGEGSLSPGARVPDRVPPKAPVPRALTSGGAARSGAAPVPAVTPVPAATVDRLAQELATRGLTVHTGPLFSSDRIVRGTERAALHEDGSIAADMESAAVLGSALAAGGRPVAAVRVVVDTPDHELLRLGTFRTGIVAFRALRAAVPAFLAWQATLAGTASVCTPDTSTAPHHPLSLEVS